MASQIARFAPETRLRVKLDLPHAKPAPRVSLQTLQGRDVKYVQLTPSLTLRTVGASGATRTKRLRPATLYVKSVLSLVTSKVKPILELYACLVRWVIREYLILSVVMPATPVRRGSFLRNWVPQHAYLVLSDDMLLIWAQQLVKSAQVEVMPRNPRHLLNVYPAPRDSIQKTGRSNVLYAQAENTNLSKVAPPVKTAMRVNFRDQEQRSVYHVKLENTRLGPASENVYSVRTENSIAWHSLRHVLIAFAELVVTMQLDVGTVFLVLSRKKAQKTACNVRWGRIPQHQLLITSPLSLKKAFSPWKIMEKRNLVWVVLSASRAIGISKVMRLNVNLVRLGNL